jgi:predicted transcriptional regulator
MAKEKNTPTASELEILSILWEKEPLTVREVHNRLSDRKDVGYTTTLKIMQNMAGKGLLTRQLNGKSHLYSSSFKKETTQQNLLDRFVDTTFGGSASGLVMQLLGNRKTTVKELEEIKKIISQLEQEK